jgi:hypothetical protein
MKDEKGDHPDEDQPENPRANEQTGQQVKQEQDENNPGDENQHGSSFGFYLYYDIFLGGWGIISARGYEAGFCYA